MRTLSANLTTAQKASSATPYIHFKIPYNEYISQRDSVASLGSPFGQGAAQWKATSFPVQSGRTLTSAIAVSFNIRKVGSPGDLTVSIKATDVNGHPTGADLASKTVAASLVTTDFAWIIATFTAASSALSPTATFALVFRAASGDVSNYYELAYTSNPPSASFFVCSSADSGSTWSKDTTLSYAFAVLGNGPTTMGKIMNVDQVEQPFAEEATVTLEDSYGELAAYGSQVGSALVTELGFGYETSSGVFEYSNVPPLKIHRQIFYEEPNGRYVKFILYGVWTKLKMMKIAAGGIRINGTLNSDTFTYGETVTQAVTGATGYFQSSGTGYILVTKLNATAFSGANAVTGATGSITPSSYVTSGAVGGKLGFNKDGNNDTIKEIIAGLINAEQQLTGGILALTEDSDDGFIETKYPKMAVLPGTSVVDVIRRVLGRCKSGLKVRSDGLHIFELTEIASNDPAAHDYAYGSDSDGTYTFDHPYLRFMKAESLVLPNTIVFVDKLPEYGTYAFAGVATNAASVTAYGSVPAIYAAEDPTEVASQGDADDGAETLLAQVVDAASGGEFTTLMNCGQEMYDHVLIKTRNILGTFQRHRGRIGLIQRIYQPGVYKMRFSLGASLEGIMPVSWLAKEMITPEPMDREWLQETIRNILGPNVTSDESGGIREVPWELPEGILVESRQARNLQMEAARVAASIQGGTVPAYSAFQRAALAQSRVVSSALQALAGYSPSEAWQTAARATGLAGALKALEQSAPPGTGVAAERAGEQASLRRRPPPPDEQSQEMT